MDTDFRCFVARPAALLLLAGMGPPRCRGLLGAPITALASAFNYRF